MNKYKKHAITLICLVILSLLGNSLFAADNATSNVEAFDEGVPESKAFKGLNKPFGENLFSGSFSAQRNSSLDPNYIVIPGDKISLHIWGAIQADEVATVDAQGNIFLPEIGAVKVAGSPAKDLPDLVRGKLRSVYKDGVDVYVNLTTATPINVFVAGPVVRPGQYAGMQNDSVLAFLHQAGGILSNQGSYRDIRIIRANRPIATFDLYSFLRWGQLPNIKFRNGDTILVGQQMATVNVLGDVRGNYRFELKRGQTLGREIVAFARPNNSVTNVALSGSRNRSPWSVYLNIGKFRNTVLKDGDTINFVTDAPSRTIDIVIEGSHLGNSFYAAKKGTRLIELLDYVAISPDDADIENIYIKRKSVAEKQRKNLIETINRLERSVLTSPAKSDGEANIRRQEATLLTGFIENARKIVPDGRVIVSDNGNVSNIRLEDGDVIVIPYRSDVIIISGEVNMPQAVVFAENANIWDYVARAGGFSERAETQQVMIKKPNGQVSLSSETYLDPGDEIIVFPKIDTKSMQYAKDIMTILFQIAAASKAVGIL